MPNSIGGERLQPSIPSDQPTGVLHPSFGQISPHAPRPHIAHQRYPRYRRPDENGLTRGEGRGGGGRLKGKSGCMGFCLLETNEKFWDRGLFYPRSEELRPGMIRQGSLALCSS